MRLHLILFLIIYSFFFQTSLYSQTNLVINPSFEEYKKCPTAEANNGLYPHKVTGWRGSYYYNTCGTIIILPRTGNGYSDMNLLGDSKSLLSTRLFGTLSSPLVKNTKYYFEFYVQLANHYAGTWAVDAIGIHFTDKELDYQDTIIPNFCNEKGKCITDTANWTKISGYYTSSGGEKYFVISNFANRENVSILLVDPYKYTKSIKKYTKVSWNNAHYFIDDVLVIPIDSISKNYAKHKLYDSINDIERFQRLNILLYGVLSEDSLKKLDPNEYFNKIIAESSDISFINRTDEFKNRLLLYAVKFLNYSFINGAPIDTIQNKINIIKDSPFGQLASISIKKKKKVIFELIQSNKTK